MVLSSFLIVWIRTIGYTIVNIGFDELIEILCGKCTAVLMMIETVGDISALGFFRTDDNLIRNFPDLSVVDLISELLVTFIDRRTDIEREKVLVDLLSCFKNSWIRVYSKDTDLFRSKPSRECALEMFGDDTKETFEGTEDGTMKPDRLFFFSVLVDVFEVETMRKLPIELNRTALPDTS